MKVIFLCHGNICRSPMAEFIFKDLVSKNNMNNIFKISSRATSCEEIGNDLYPKAKKVLDSNGVKYTHHSAKRITLAEYNEADFVLAMEEYNIVNLKRVIGTIDENKVFLLRNWSNPKKDIEDPWYSNNFDKVFQEILEGCFDFLNFILKRIS